MLPHPIRTLFVSILLIGTYAPAQNHAKQTLVCSVVFFASGDSATKQLSGLS